MKTLKNFLIFFCLIFNQNLESVEMIDRWKLISETPVLNNSSWYLDPESIKRKNGFLYVWVLTNYQIKLDGGYYSTIAYWMVDCDLMRNKYLDLTAYKKMFGNGEPTVIRDENMDIWQYSPPDSNGYFIKEFACASF